MTKSDKASDAQRADIYERITASIVAKLEEGTRPWMQPRGAGASPIRPLRHNGVAYRRINTVLLWMTATEQGYVSSYWITYKQALEMKGQVRKGERSTLVVYAGSLERNEEDVDGEQVERRIPFLKAYSVFCADQIEELPAHFYAKAETPKGSEQRQRIARADSFFANLGADIREGGSAAYYNPARDFIQMPRFDAFDVFALASYLTGMGFPAALDFVGALVSFQPSFPIWSGKMAKAATQMPVVDRWEQRRRPWRTSATSTYLHRKRALPWRIISNAIKADLLREGPYGSMWAMHSDAEGTVIGWEERGPAWRGFSAGGAKELFCFGIPTAPRICVTEAAIDAMSLAALEDRRKDTLYVSTGGGWAPRTQHALEVYANRQDVHLVAATDADVQGEVFADRIRQMAATRACDFSRLRPAMLDWNEELQQTPDRMKDGEAR